MDGELLPAVLIARRLGVSKQLVRWWVDSGKLPIAHVTEDGRKLYDLNKAAVVDRDTAKSPYSHRIDSVA